MWETVKYALDNLRTTEKSTCILSTDMKHVRNEKNCIVKALEFIFICIHVYDDDDDNNN